MRGVTTLAAMVLLWATNAGAQEVAVPDLVEQPISSPAASEECLAVTERLSASEIDEFIADPGVLLTQYPNGGIEMSTRVRALVGSSARAFDAIVAIIPSANDAQMGGIGAALARVVSACSQGQNENTIAYGERIQLFVANLGDGPLLVAFAEAAQDIEVAEIDVIAAAAADSSNAGAFGLDDAGRVSGAANTFSLGGDEATPTQSVPFSVGSAGSFTAASVSPSTP
jgi:hypothetical protein